MSRNLHTENMDRLLDGVLTLKTREEAYCFFEDLCTLKELSDMTQRFEIAEMLIRGSSCKETSDKARVSSTTVCRVKKALDYGEEGYKTVFSRLEEKNGD